MSGDRRDLAGRTALVTGASRRIALQRISKPDVAAAAPLASDAAAWITGEVLVVNAGKRL